MFPFHKVVSYLLGPMSKKFNDASETSDFIKEEGLKLLENGKNVYS